MSDEQKTPVPEPDGQPQRSAPTDRWQLWFFRLVQLTGWLGVPYEALFKNTDRPWLLLMFGAMILGGYGVELVVGFFLRRVTG